MQTKIDPSKFDTILSAALRYCVWISRIGVERDTNGKVSTPILIPLTTVKPEVFIEEVEKTWLKTMKQYNADVLVTNEFGEQRQFKFSSLLWGRMCVTAYYFYRDDPFWRNVGIPELRNVNNVPLINSDVDIAINKIDTLFEKNARIKITYGTSNTTDQTSEAKPNLQPTNEEQSARIAELERLVAQQDEEIKALKKHIAELEEQLHCYQPSFIVTEGKRPEDIRGVCRSIARATTSAADMAQCVHELHIQNYLRNQDRTKPIKGINKIFDELQNVYHFEWKISALYRALNRLEPKK